MRSSLLFLLVVSLAAAQSQERECKCILNNLYLDVYIIIDDSAQMGTSGLFEVASNLNSVFGYTQIRVGDHYADGRGVRTAVITYNSVSTVRANLSDFQSADELTSLAYSLKPNNEMTSNLQSPLKVVQEMLAYTDQNAPRNNTRAVVLIYAADYVDYDEPTIAQIGNQMKKDGITIITVADVSRNTDGQLGHLAGLASPGDHFNVNDDYVSEEVQQAFCGANCFCPPMYHQFVVHNNATNHKYATCVLNVAEQTSWTNAKFACQNLHRTGYLATEFTAEKHKFNRKLFESVSTEPLKYHVGLHYVNGGYFWEQSTGLPLVPLGQSLYTLQAKPTASAQCVANTENSVSKEEQWENVNCFNEFRPYLCEVAACDTEDFCS